MKKGYVFFLAFLFLAQCRTMSSVVITGKTYAPLAPDAAVQVFNSKKPDKYEEIGIIEVKGGDLAGRIEEAKKKAREVGGNGLIVGQEMQQSNSMPVTEFKTATADDGTVINYSEDRHDTVTWINQKFTVIRVQ